MITDIRKELAALAERNTENKKNIKNALKHNLIERRKEAKIIRRIVTIITLVIFLIIGGVAFSAYKYIKSALQPLDENNKQTVNIEVPIGSSSTSIGKLLKEKKIIKDATVFKYYVKLNNISGFQAGNYSFSPSMTLEEITSSLQDGGLDKEVVFKITVPEGKNIEEIAKVISEHVDMSQEEIVKLIDSKEFVEKMEKEFPTLLQDDINNKEIKHPLEGYLFPATYSFYDENESAENIVREMLKHGEKVIKKYVALIDEAGLSLHEVITMASLIEKEATAKADRQMIASVFYNRLDEDMMLQTDPTVAYAHGKHLSVTTYEDLKIESPYNTYFITGLPVGPIASPGIESIEAAIDPAESDYLYFLAEHGTGDVYYAKTLEEHNALKQKHIIEKRENGE